MENMKPPRSKQANSLTDPQPSTSRQTDKTPVESKATGGGGADSAHGQAFHFNVAQLMLFGLYEESKSELGFDYKIWLEKEGYGKFDDIVVQYKKPEGKTMQICVQCKHGEEKIHSDGTKTVKNITAVDFLSNRNKSFSLAEYIRSFVTIQNKNIKIFDLETYFVLLSNRAYMSEKDSSYAFLERDENVDINQLFALDIFEHDCFRIKCNDNFGDFLQKQISSNGNADTNVTNDVIRDFCDKFIYIRDKRELDHVLEQKILQHCRQNSETAKNLKARLYYLVSQMYQHKTNPTKNDIIYEFNGTNVYFRVPPACPKFSGRVIEIQRIKEALECEKKGAVFDLLVTGMAGMGKTQIFRKYIDENRQKYKHVVWINAENKDTLEKSFVELAKDCKLISSDSKDETTIIVKAIYSYFRDQTLFVFDNTNKVLLSKNEDEKYIYLPINDKYKQNKFIIISQDQKWTTNHLPIVVDKFIDADALIYLDASIECSRNDKIKLAFSFQYWPLALCLAVSYIKLETENSLGCRSCSDVINILQIEMFNKHKPVNHEMEPYTNSLNSLWLTIHNKLQAENKHSIEILNVLAFSHPDNFPVKLLKFDDVDEWQVKAAVNTLKNYSIVNVSDFKISIHRTLQSVIKATIMSDIDLYETVLLKTSQCFNIYLQSMDPNEKMKTLGNLHMVTFLQHTNQSNLDPQKYIKMANRLLQNLNDSQDLMGYSETQGIFYQILKVAEDALGVNHEDNLCAIMRTAQMLYTTGKFAESLDHINNLLAKYTEKFGNKHYKTLGILGMKAFVLNQMGEYEKALSIYNHVIDIETEILGDEHPSLLTSMHNKALVLKEIGEYEKALSIYNHVIEIRTEILGEKHPSLLTSMHNKASVLKEIGEFEKALSIYNQVIEIETEILGDKHPSLLNSMHNKALVLNLMGEYEKTLSIFNHVIEMRIKILGEKHPHTVQSIKARENALESIRLKNVRRCLILTLSTLSMFAIYKILSRLR